MSKLRNKFIKWDSTVNINGQQVTNGADASTPTGLTTLQQVQSEIASAAASLAFPEFSAISYLGNRTITQINALSPTIGDTVVATASGTPTYAGSAALATGDVAEFQGTGLGWQVIVANSGGFVPNGTKLIIANPAITLFAPLTDGTDDGKVAHFDGTSNTPSSKLSPVDGGIGLINNVSSSNFNTAWDFTGAVPTGIWSQFSGIRPQDAGAGLSKTGTIVNVGDAGKGVQVNADNLQVNAAQIADNGLQQKTGSGNEHLLQVKSANTSIDVSGAGVKAAVPVTSNKNQASLAVSTDNASTGIAIASTPAAGSMVTPHIGSYFPELGNGVKTKDCYFSADSGSTAKAYGSIVASDVLYFNAVIAGVSLDTSDLWSLEYNVA